MFVPSRYARCLGVFGFLLILLCPLVCFGTDVSRAPEQGADRWELLNFTFLPAAAVFRNGTRDHVLAVGSQLPGTPMRLVRFLDDSAEIELITSSGAQLRLSLKRGEALDIGRALRELEAALQSNPAPAVSVAGDSHVE